MTDTSPAAELPAAAFLLRNPGHGLQVGIDPELGIALADWLDAATESFQPGRIHGTDLIVCPDCCQELPCDHIRPALAVARLILGEAQR